MLTKGARHVLQCDCHREQEYCRFLLCWWIVKMVVFIVGMLVPLGVFPYQQHGFLQIWQAQSIGISSAIRYLIFSCVFVAKITKIEGTLCFSSITKINIAHSQKFGLNWYCRSQFHIETALQKYSGQLALLGNSKCPAF